MHLQAIKAIVRGSSEDGLALRLLRHPRGFPRPVRSLSGDLLEQVLRGENAVESAEWKTFEEADFVRTTARLDIITEENEELGLAWIAEGLTRLLSRVDLRNQRIEFFVPGQPVYVRYEGGVGLVLADFNEAIENWLMTLAQRSDKARGAPADPECPDLGQGEAFSKSHPYAVLEQLEGKPYQGPRTFWERLLDN
jgi:hypothetical protein